MSMRTQRRARRAARAHDWAKMTALSAVRHDRPPALPRP